MSECSYGSPFYESSGRRKYGCPWGDAPRLGWWNLASRYRRDVTFMSWRQNDDMWNRFETIPERYRRQTSSSCHIANRLYRLDRRLAKNVKRVSVSRKKTSWNFWNISEIFHEIFQGKNVMTFYITMCGRAVVRSVSPADTWSSSSSSSSSNTCQTSRAKVNDKVTAWCLSLHIYFFRSCRW